MGNSSAKAPTLLKDPVVIGPIAPDLVATNDKAIESDDSLPDIICDDEIEPYRYEPGKETDIPQYTNDNLDLTAEWVYHDGPCEHFIEPNVSKAIEAAFLLGSVQTTGTISDQTYIVVFADSKIRIDNKGYMLQRKEQASEKIFWIAEDSTERPLPKGLQQLVLRKSEPVLVGLNDIAYKVDMASMTLENMHNDMVMPLIMKSE